jgi:hypothetical protein
LQLNRLRIKKKALIEEILSLGLDFLFVPFVDESTAGADFLGQPWGNALPDG